MQKIIVAIFVLIAASFLISFLFNDFHIDLKKAGEEFIRMLGIVLVVVLLLRAVSKKEVINAILKDHKPSGSQATIS